MIRESGMGEQEIVGQGNREKKVIIKEVNKETRK
jgi:hypothetical protein